MHIYYSNFLKKNQWDFNLIFPFNKITAGSKTSLNNKQNPSQNTFFQVMKKKGNAPVVIKWGNIHPCLEIEIFFLKSLYQDPCPSIRNVLGFLLQVFAFQWFFPLLWSILFPTWHTASLVLGKQGYLSTWSCWALYLLSVGVFLLQPAISKQWFICTIRCVPVQVLFLFGGTLVCRHI